MVNPDIHYSSPSELESTYSDSDWLDIPSSHVSEDNDSVAGFDDYSDREGIDRPSSRRSFSSLASSREDAPEGWEGLIEDSADEASSNEHDAFVDPITSAEISLDEANKPDATQNDPDEERVKAGLEQSMMSTLSSSRSNSLSASMQTSIVRSTRDLRLSFPDPLTSSQEHLSNASSYENLITSNAQDPLTEADDNDASSIGDAADPGTLSTPEVPVKLVPSKHSSAVPSGITPDFCIALYGFSGFGKATLVDSLLEKWAYTAGLERACSLTHAPGVTTQVFITRGSSDTHATRRYVSVLDRTGTESIDRSSSSIQLSCPSLAVVFLPFSSTDFILPEHSLYLPAVGSSPFTTVDAFATSDYLLDAEQQWESFGVPTEKLTSLSDWSTPVVDEEKIQKASSERVYQVFQSLVASSTKKARSPIRAQTIMLAVLSIVLGYVVHGTFQPSPTAVHVYDHNASRTIDILQSVGSCVEKRCDTSLIATSAAIVAVSTSPPKAVDVAVFSPFTAIASTSSVAPVPLASSSALDHSDQTTTPTECECGCGMVAWLSTDLVVRPSTPAPALVTDARSKGILGFIGSSRSNAKGKGKVTSLPVEQDTSLYSLSTRIGSSLSEYLDFKALLNSVGKDVQKESQRVQKEAQEVQNELQELLDALDHLADAVSRQTAAFWEQSRGTASLLRDEVYNRNGHAREKAKQLKGYGERILGSIGETIKFRSDIAKEKAQTFKDRFVNSELGEKIKKAKQDAIEGTKARRMKRKERRQQRRAHRAKAQ